jgi:hypothetical protein
VYAAAYARIGARAEELLAQGYDKLCLEQKQRERAADAALSGKRDSSEQPLKQNDHVMDATRYALHSEFGEGSQADAYLANMRRRLSRPRDPRDVRRNDDDNLGALET